VPLTGTFRDSLGGTKKKTLAGMEKEQERKDEEEKSKEKKASKGSKLSRSGGPQFAVTIRDEDALQQLAPLKAITLYSATKVLGVKASVTAGIIRSMAEKGLIEKVGGFSGHYVYAVKKK